MPKFPEPQRCLFIIIIISLSRPLSAASLLNISPTMRSSLFALLLAGTGYSLPQKNERAEGPPTITLGPVEGYVQPAVRESPFPVACAWRILIKEFDRERVRQFSLGWNCR